MDIIFHWVGVAVCCAAGLFATGFFLLVLVLIIFGEKPKQHTIG